MSLCLLLLFYSLKRTEVETGYEEYRNVKSLYIFSCIIFKCIYRASNTKRNYVLLKVEQWNIRIVMAHIKPYNSWGGGWHYGRDQLKIALAADTFS